MERDLDRDLERLRDLEADFVDLDITAASPPQTVTQKSCTAELGFWRIKDGKQCTKHNHLDVNHPSGHLNGQLSRRKKRI